MTPADMMAAMPVLGYMDEVCNKFFDNIKDENQKTAEDLIYISTDLTNLFKEIRGIIDNDKKLIDEAKNVVHSRFVVDVLRDLSVIYNINFDYMFEYLDPSIKTTFNKATKYIITPN